MRYHAERSFVRGSATPARARSWLLARMEEALAEEPSGVAAAELEAADAGELEAEELLEDAALIVSELVTNAVRAGCGRTRLEVAVDERQVRIAVIDDAPGVPAIFEPTARDVHGRGLHIVAAVASQWGVRRVGDSKEVWAVLPFAQRTRPVPLAQGAPSREIGYGG